MLKKMFDGAASLILLVAVSPILFTVAMVLLCTQGRPILFKQERPGLRGDVFMMLKFRTMRVEENLEAHAVSKTDGIRLTKVGRWLRDHSVDELPTLFNVLMGDMSLVGPRPLLVAYLPRYNVFQNRRHEVRPGITGWAQIHGRNNLSWPEKFELDVWYVDHRSFLLDIKILIKTCFKVVNKNDINQVGFDTADEFYGNDLKNESNVES